jgi:hypothetical protein
MKNIFRFSVAVLLMLPMAVSAQQKSDPEGYLTYSLPSTTIMLDVEAVKEQFYAGPYAKYAEKYLGIKVRQKNETSVQLTQVKMVPYVEADQSRRYSINVKKGNVESFLKLTAEGLVSFSDARYVDPSAWRFPTDGQGDFSGKGVSSNLTSESATLYHSGSGRGSVKQDMVVGKTTEQRAAETAEMILDLRSQRLQIVTGDTDATYSGEAMGAAIAEITRLEEEYMMLFTGYSERQTQTMRFEVAPVQNQENQMYIAFRLSDADGLVPADNLSGKPVIMQIIPQEFAQPEVPVEEKKDKKVEILVHYRIPAVCTVKLMEGANLLLQSRIPVYQLGQESSTPINVLL